MEYGTSEDSEWYKIDPGWSEESLGLIYNQFGIIHLRRSPILQTSNWSGTFFCCFLQQTGSSLKSIEFEHDVQKSMRYGCLAKEV